MTVSTADPPRPEHAQEGTPGAAFYSRTGQPGSPAPPTRQNGSQGRTQEGMTMNDQTTDALNRVAAQLARVAAAIESSTAHTPRHAAEPDDPVADAEVVDSPKVWTVEDLEELPVGWTVHDRDGDPWIKTDGTVDGYAAWRLSGSRGDIIGSQRLLDWVNSEPDVERGAPDRKLRVWTFEDLEALPIGWVLRDRDGDPWEKVGYRGDGTSMWRPGDSDSLPRSSEALMRWMNPVNVAGMTVEELAAADNGTRVVDSLNDTWRKEGDEFVNVQWPSASPVTPKTLHHYGPILEATR